MNGLTFTELLNLCRTIAEEIGTLFQYVELPEYGWSGISFATDKFGGVYVNLHYDHRTGKIINEYGSVHEREVTGIVDLIDLVRTEKAKMEAARDMETVCRRINEEYYCTNHRRGRKAPGILPQKGDTMNSNERRMANTIGRMQAELDVLRYERRVIADLIRDLPGGDLIHKVEAAIMRIETLEKGKK